MRSDVATRVESAASGRWTLVERLGGGAMGEVYRARDADLGNDVALKVLHARTAEDLFRLKSEFRALADLRHPYLVALHDLVVTPEISFFTMELVAGLDLVAWVRGVRAGAAGAPPDGGFDRLRRALPQLAGGLESLHDAGRLHRDVKPTNVLVTPGGRVVLVDFGLALLRPLAREEGSDASELAGTPAYLAPELLWGAEASPASDLFAVGVTLFEAATGERPFPGDLRARLARAGERRAPSPRDLVPEMPADLAETVTELLAVEPSARPTAAMLRRRFATDAERPSVPSPSTASLWEAPFVDREDVLAMLEKEVDRVRGGEGAAIRIEGPSGIGKSALARHFLAGLVAREHAVVLSGRCYPQESVPFKAVDPLIDGLSRFLASLDEAEVEVRESVPAARAGPLVRLFPVLGRIPVLARAAAASTLPAEPEDLRRAGFEALRALLARLAERRLVALWIDDLQWGDTDSAVLLRTITTGSGTPPILLLMTHRAAEWEMSPIRAALTTADGEALGRPLVLEPLPASEARRLTDVLLEPIAAASDRRDEIVREAGGNPFLLCELARSVAFARVAGVGDEFGLPRVGDIVADRLRPLGDAARRLVTVVAVSGRPCTRTVAARAAGVERGVGAAVTELRNQCLVRDSAGGEGARLETYHDRIRESVVERLSGEERRALHLALAGALELEAEVDPFELVEHYRGAGDERRAATAASSAAARAHAALAFDQAARLYEVALEADPASPERPHWLRGRADALAQSGRGGEAGAAYRSAAVAAERRGDPASAVQELVRLASQQYLRSGYLDEGREALARVLDEVGEPYPATPLAAFFSLLRHRLALELRGFGSRRRSADAVPAELLGRADACWAAAEGLIWADGLRSADFQTRYTRLALAAGEPHRVVRALCTEAAYQALLGTAWGAKRARRVLADAHALAAELDSPLAEGLIEVCEAGAAYLSGRFPEARDHSRRAEEILRTGCTGVAWEITNTHIFGSWSLAYMGDLAALGESMPEIVARAGDRGDLLARCTLLGGLPNTLRLLAADRSAEAREAVREAVERWPTKDFQLPNYFTMVSAALVDLYDGDPGAAFRRVEETWPRVRGVGLLAFRLVRTEARALRARCRLARLTREGLVPARERARALRRVRREARRLAREDIPWASPLAAALEAGVASAAGDAGGTSRALRRAARGFDDASMVLHAAAARHLQGERAGTDLLVERGVVAPDRFAAMLLPLPSPSGAEEDRG